MSEAAKLYEQGRRAEQGGRFQEALRFYKASARQDPNFREAYNNLGVLYARARRPDLAIGFFQRAFEIKEDAKVCFNLGSELFRLERFSESEFYLVRTLQHDRRMVRAHVLLAYLYSKQKRWDRAVNYFSNALKLEPANRPAALGFTVLLSDQNRFAEALEVSRAYLAHVPSDQTFQRLQAGFLLKAEDHKASLQAYSTLAKTDTKFSAFTDHLAAARKESQAEYSQVFDGIDDKIRERADRLRERIRRRKEWLQSKQGQSMPTEPGQLKTDLKDMVDLSFLHLFNGDPDKALAFLLQARKMKQDADRN